MARTATPPAAEQLQDKPADPAAVSDAPPRVHASLVSGLQLRWDDLTNYVSRLDGTADGLLGDVIDFVRSKL